MSWEYKVIEPLDYGHPGASPRYGEFADELTAHSKDGWEFVQMIPGMMRGRIIPGGKDTEQVNITTVGICALLRRKVE